MSETLLFEIGAVIFLAVVTAAFLYGLMEFRDWQDRDETQNGRVDIEPADEPAIMVVGAASRPSAA